MITMISTISVVGVIYWRYSLSVMDGKSFFQKICCIYEHRIYRVNLSRDLTPRSHVLSNDMWCRGRTYRHTGIFPLALHSLNGL